MKPTLLAPHRVTNSLAVEVKADFRILLHFKETPDVKQDRTCSQNLKGKYASLSH